MKYPFYILKNTITLFRYSVTYTEPVYDENGEETGETREEVQGTRTMEQANRKAERTGGTVAPLDTTDYEWMDGIEITEPTTNPMIQALEIYHMGREAWEARQNAPTAEDRMAQMEADIAYLAMLTDTDLEV